VSLDPRAAAFGGAAECYERGRPGYPLAAIARLVEELAVSRASVVLDLAAGTGKLTRALLPHAGQVIAVEPVADMRRELAARRRQGARR
jgi:16S rRNA A1518/A1519 N6-dimethyltransferase RsmA/KsgA/DIM1 with predicted DNA glycosylase/AP lyase activity